MKEHKKGFSYYVSPEEIDQYRRWPIFQPAVPMPTHQVHRGSATLRKKLRE